MKKTELHIKSDSLKHATEGLLLLPESSDQPHSVLYLLHGAKCCPQDFLEETNLAAFVDEYGIAVVLPCCPDSFYLSLENVSGYFHFLATELHKYIPDTYNQTFIGGISIGGYGALRTALEYPERFSKAFSLSGALRMKLGLRYMKVCGLEVPPISDMVQEEVTELLDSNTKCKPELMLYCGQGDPFLSCNQSFGKQARERAYIITENYDRGDHDWEYWRRELPKCIAWLMEDKK